MLIRQADISADTAGTTKILYLVWNAPQPGHLRAEVCRLTHRTLLPGWTGCLAVVLRPYGSHVPRAS